jgi:hypothetical protein
MVSGNLLIYIILIFVDNHIQIIDQDEDIDDDDDMRTLFTCTLLTLFNACMSMSKSDHQDDISPEFIQEWNEFFVNACASSILSYFLRVAGKCLYHSINDHL